MVPRGQERMGGGWAGSTAERRHPPRGPSSAGSSYLPSPTSSCLLPLRPPWRWRWTRQPSSSSTSTDPSPITTHHHPSTPSPIITHHPAFALCFFTPITHRHRHPQVVDHESKISLIIANNHKSAPITASHRQSSPSSASS